MARTGLVLVGMAVGLAGWGAAARADDITSRMQACRATADIAARAACYDRIVDEFNRAYGIAPPAPVAAAPQTRAAPAAPARPAANPVDQFGAKDLSQNQRLAADETPPDQIIARVAQMTSEQGYATVTLDNGQVWRQTEASSINIRSGSRVRIKSGLLGAYYMSLEDSNKSSRVKRLK